MTITELREFKTPWQRHREHARGLQVTTYSPNGFDVFEECGICQLCWLLPNVINRNKYPITIRRYPMEGGKK